MCYGQEEGMIKKRKDLNTFVDEKITSIISCQEKEIAKVAKIILLLISFGTNNDSHSNKSKVICNSGQELDSK
eukprot:6717329-Ditylum_brightwellii.AAC.1